jgi:hypothetical protein
MAGEPAEMFLGSNEKEMIEMGADGVGTRPLPGDWRLGEIQVKASLDSIFENLAIAGQLELLSRKVA